MASPGSALREYKAGKYDEALKEYERLLKEKNDDPRLHFNAGAAAYRNRQFDEATKQFHATLDAPDLKLQGLAYYNEGNALYHLGEQSADPKQRQESWENALQNYQNTLQLNPHDADAKFNYDFVKKKLEELKRQQQRSQQNKQNKKQDQEQKQQDQNQQQNQQKQKDQQQQQAQQNQKQKSSQQQKAEEQKKQQEQQQAAQKSQPQKPDQQQAQQSSGKPKEKPDEKDQQAAQAQQMAQMTPEQARQLLDAQKGDEQMLPMKPPGKPEHRSRPIKDW